jgi:hypothetical protein
MNANTNTRRFARHFAPPIASAGIIGGAALGLAGTAGAVTTVSITSRHCSRATLADNRHRRPLPIRNWGRAFLRWARYANRRGVPPDRARR